MGMYTELNINVCLKDDVPKWVIDILKFQVGDIKDMPQITDHNLFNCHRWEWMLRMDSYYFDADTHSTLRFSDNARCWYLNVQCNLKNYDNEIDEFIDFIKPYVDTDGFWGHKRYEEFDDPTLIYDGVFK